AVVCATPGATVSGPQLFERLIAPRVLSAEVPSYPPSARAADLSGRVELDVAVKNGAVISVRTLNGDLLLAHAATRNIRTWQFSKDTATSFTIIFDYRLVAEDLVGPRIEMALPYRVTITESLSKW